MNPYRLQWIVRVRINAALTSGAKSVAEVLAVSGVVSPVAMTDWQEINRVLHRPPRDTAAHNEIKELQAAGYLGRWQGNRFHKSRGWRLALPEEATVIAMEGV